jgi:prevent-host-death family protein
MDDINGYAVMEIVNIHEAKTHLSRLIRRVKGGEPFVIALSGEPVALVSPYQSESSQPRQPGSMRGKIWIAEDFDAPDPDIERLFNGEDE